MSGDSGFPNQLSPLVDQNGVISKPWSQFLVTLWNRTGGSLSGVVSRFNGRTGDVSLTEADVAAALGAASAKAGQILIGNGSGLSLANLTQGANVTITNSPGGITIAADAASVSSVFGRTGTVTATTGDYSIGQITGAGALASLSGISTLLSAGSNVTFTGAGTTASPYVVAATVTASAITGGTAPVADGTYTVGLGSTTNGTITTKNGIVTAITQAS